MTTHAKHRSSGATGTLHLVATPIGNLGDISPRVSEILSTCDRVACEDTRVTGKLLKHLEIEKPLISYRDENEKQQAEHLIGVLKAGESIALVSDAGTPTISDPGFRLTRLCHLEKIPVLSIPGPSALICALAVSGLPSNGFLFLGFLAPKKSARIKTFTEYQSFPYTLIIYESPHRIEKCLLDLQEVLGDERVVSVSKELTKLHEHTFTGPLHETVKHIQDRSQKGEFVVCIAPEAFSL